MRSRRHESRQDALTFLHGLEWVVGLNELDGVCDLLALQDVVTQAEVGHGELEHLIVSHCILLEDGAWGEKKTRKTQVDVFCQSLDWFQLVFAFDWEGKSKTVKNDASIIYGKTLVSGWEYNLLKRFWMQIEANRGLCWQSSLTCADSSEARLYLWQQLWSIRPRNQQDFWSSVCKYEGEVKQSQRTKSRNGWQGKKMLVKDSGASKWLLANKYVSLLFLDMQDHARVQTFRDTELWLSRDQNFQKT